MRNLNLHAGGDLQTREQLAALNYPAPKGSRHVIRPFDEDVNLIEQLIGEVGYEVADSAIGVKFDKDNLARQFFGTLELRPKAIEGEYLPAGEFAINVGIRGSADQSLPRGVVAGHRIFVCSNLCFSGDLLQASTKQTLRIGDRIETILRDAISLLPAEIERENTRLSAYKNYNLSQQKGDAILIELVRQGARNASDLPTAIKEWDTPRFAEHAQHGRTIYSLFAACTQAFQPRDDGRRANIPTAWTRGQKLTHFLDRGVGLLH